MRDFCLVWSSMVVAGCVTPTQNNLPDGGSTSTEEPTGAGPSSTASSTMSTSASGATDPATETSDATDATSSGSTDPTGGSGGIACGDAEIEGSEVCDDGINDGSYGGCADDCMSLGPYCGDAEVQRGAGEACDDGDDVDGNGCNIDCIESGAVLWTATYSSDDGESLDLAFDVAVDDDGTVLVVAQRLSSGLGDPPIGSTLLWYDGDGNEVEALARSAVYSAGAFGGPGYVLVEEYDGDAEESAIAGFDSAHDEHWRRVFAGSGVRAITFDGSDALFVGGSRIEGTAPFYTHDPLLALLDGDGNVMWQDIDTSSNGICVDAALMDEAVLYLCGSETRWVDADGNETTSLPQDLGLIDARPNGTYAGASGFDLYGYDAAGAEQWTVPTFSPYDLAIDGAGNVVVVGNENYDIAIAKYTADGQELWTDFYGEDEPASARGVAIAPDDTIVVAATIERFATGQGADIWIRKYAP